MKKPKKKSVLHSEISSLGAKALREKMTAAEYKTYMAFISAKGVATRRRNAELRKRKTVERGRGA